MGSVMPMKRTDRRGRLEADFADGRGHTEASTTVGGRFLNTYERRQIYSRFKLRPRPLIDPLGPEVFDGTKGQCSDWCRRVWRPDEMYLQEIDQVIEEPSIDI